MLENYHHAIFSRSINLCIANQDFEKVIGLSNFHYFSILYQVFMYEQSSQYILSQLNQLNNIFLKNWNSENKNI